MRVLPIALTLLALPGICSGMWILSTEDVPVERIAANMEARLAQHPRDAKAHYVLGRVHAMAYARDTEIAAVEPPEQEGGLYGFAPYQSMKVDRHDTPPSKAAVAHFHASVVHYRKATELAPRDAPAWLGLAFVLDAGCARIPWLGTPDGAATKAALPSDEIARYEGWIEALTGPEEGRAAARRGLIAALPRAAEVLRLHLRTEDQPEREAVVGLLRRHWEDQAADAYRKAHVLALPDDRGTEFFPMAGDQPLSVEAGRGLLAILERREQTRAVEDEVARVRRALEEIDAKPRFETPILFPVRGAAPLRDLVDAAADVSFDMDGDGEPRRWPWVRPAAALLVWDPGGKGRVTSGRALFGARTWWIRWDDGYAALSALDDDDDGTLRGAELDGLAVWIDADGDAVSDPGEVRPLRAHGIVSIAARAVAVHDGVPSHAAGVTFEDGATRPTYDWTPRSR